jgi:hypothetical protein
MDIGKAFSYPFEDEKWLSKLFLGAIVSAVPILNFAWTGYTVDIVRNVSDGVSLPLPDWSEFGEKFVKGFLVWAAGFIYSLPAFIIACLPLGLLAIPALGESSNLSDTFFSVFTGVGIFLICLIVLYLLVFSFYFPAVYINFARKGTFGSCFEIGEIIKIVSEDTSEYLTAWLVSIVGAIIVSIVIWLISILLSPIICLGWILAWLISAIGGAYMYVIFSHLFGQVSAEKSLTTSIPEIEE